MIKSLCISPYISFILYSRKKKKTKKKRKNNADLRDRRERNVGAKKNLDKSTLFVSYFQSRSFSLPLFSSQRTTRILVIMRNSRDNQKMRSIYNSLLFFPHLFSSLRHFVQTFVLTYILGPFCRIFYRETKHMACVCEIFRGFCEIFFSLSSYVVDNFIYLMVNLTII